MDIKDIEKAFGDDLERDSENRNNAQDDIRFGKLGEQWPFEVKESREREGRPCHTINRIPAFIRQVVNDSRINSPQIKVKPVDDDADSETAEVLAGLIRNIEYTSQADVAYDTALDSAASCGMGFFRIKTEYSDEESFAQDIYIERITNPLSVVYDSYSESIDGSDWERASVIDWMSKDSVKKKYGVKKDSDLISFADSVSGLTGNDDTDMIRIAEYWNLEEEQIKLVMLSNGTVMTEEEYLKPHPELGMPIKEIMDNLGIQVARTRKSTRRKIRQYICGGDILEENEWAGKYIPIVPVFGDEVFAEGKRYLKSLFRDAKDAQIMYNYWRTATTELVALAPKTPFIGKAGAFDTDAEKWATANVKSHPYIEYDGDLPPQRQPFVGVPAGAMQEALTASDDMKSIIGMHDASLGARSNETSGRAILARQREGDVSTFHFIDNLAKSIAHGGRILVDLIPKIYDTERVIRIIGQGDESENIQLKQQTEYKGVQRIFDFNVGKYDVAVDTGPSFTTQREEAAAQMIELVRSFPDAAPIIGDLLAKNLNWPDSDEIAKRLKVMLPPQIQALEKNENIPPQIMQIMEAGKQQIGQMSQAIQQLQQEKTALEQQADSKQLDNSSKERIAQINADIKQRELDIKERELAVKEIESNLANSESILSIENMRELAGMLDEMLATQISLAEKVKEPKQKVISIRAPSGATYTGVVDDGNVLIQAPSGATYQGTVDENG